MSCFTCRSQQGAEKGQVAPFPLFWGNGQPDPFCSASRSQFPRDTESIVLDRSNIRERANLPPSRALKLGPIVIGADPLSIWIAPMWLFSAKLARESEIIVTTEDKSRGMAY